LYLFFVCFFNCFVFDAVTEYHKLGDLKHHKLPYNCNSEVRNHFYLTEVKVLAMLDPFGTLRRIHTLTVSRFWRPSTFLCWWPFPYITPCLLSSYLLWTLPSPLPYLKDSCNYIRPTWIILDNLLISRSLTWSHLQSLFAI
jgi:hypothetical protein